MFLVFRSLVKKRNHFFAQAVAGNVGEGLNKSFQ